MGFGEGMALAGPDPALDKVKDMEVRIADLGGALYLSFIKQGCLPDEAKVYMLMAVGYQEGRAWLEAIDALEIK